MEKEGACSDFAKKVKSDATEYINGVFAGSTNFVQRFVTFLTFSQLLYLLLFILSKLFWWFGWYVAIRGLLLTFFAVSLFFLFIFLFKNVRAKALTFFSSGIIYFVLSLLIAGGVRVESFLDLLVSINDISFLGGWAIWNLLYSIVILLIGTARTFLLGFVYDYQNKE